ncbi:hypothetical protein L9F63_016408, partial [Diploptera punctata]
VDYLSFSVTIFVQTSVSNCQLNSSSHEEENPPTFSSSDASNSSIISSSCEDKLACFNLTGKNYPA